MGVALAPAAKAWTLQNKEEMETAVALIRTEENSADNLELDVTRELSNHWWARRRRGSSGADDQSLACRYIQFAVGGSVLAIC